MSLIQRCPYLRVSFKRGSTVYILHSSGPLTHLVGVEHLHGVASTELEFEQVLVLFVVALVVLLALDLQLLIVHLMAYLSCLLLLWVRVRVRVRRRVVIDRLY